LKKNKQKIVFLVLVVNYADYEIRRRSTRKESVINESFFLFVSLLRLFPQMFNTTNIKC
jgi:hypothetical protein